MEIVCLKKPTVLIKQLITISLFFQILNINLTSSNVILSEPVEISWL